MTATRWWGRGAEQGVHELARDATLRLRAGGAGLVLRATSGCVLVTREGDRDDHVLEPGEELRLEGRGLVVAWALAPSRLAVAGAPAGAGARAGRREKAIAGA